MRLAFLGTGAAFSLERYNGAVVVDGHILLDAGAPLLPHMHRLGIDPGAIDTCFLTHFHGDHTLSLATFLLHRCFRDPRPLTIVSPDGGEARIEALMDLAWGDDWQLFRDRFELSHVVAGPRGEVNGIPFETVRLDHGSRGCTGYRLGIGGRRLVYAGDSEPTPPLEELVSGADVVITEATGPGSQPSHTGWEEAAALAARHPGTRFIFNHCYEGEVSGGARDLEVMDV